VSCSGDALKKFGVEIYESRKEEDKAAWESMIVEVIARMCDELPEQRVLEEEGGVSRKIYTKDLLHEIKGQYGDEFGDEFNAKKLGYILKELGIPRKKDRTGRYIDCDVSALRIERLKARYGLEGVK